MPAHGGRGFYEYFEDFLVTVIGDLPEIDIQSATGVSTAIQANQFGGVVEIPTANSNDQDVAAVSTNLNWTTNANGYLIGEARVKWDTSVDGHWFVGFGDSIASADETVYSVSGDTYAKATMTDAVGFYYNVDATTDRIICIATGSDAITTQTALSTRFNPIVGTYYVFRVAVGPGALSIEWSIDGEVVARADRAPGLTTAYVSVTAPLALGVWSYEEGTTNEIELDYLYARKGRMTGDAA